MFLAHYPICFSIFASSKVRLYEPNTLHVAIYLAVTEEERRAELLVYQLGHPYHINFDNHKRWRYKDKERAMCMDIFSLDKCRALYEWLPMVEHYNAMITNPERQLIARICIDAIRKHTRQEIQRQYYGGALIGVNDRDWCPEYYVHKRETIDIEEDSRE